MEPIQNFIVIPGDSRFDWLETLDRHLYQYAASNYPYAMDIENLLDSSLYQLSKKLLSSQWVKQSPFHKTLNAYIEDAINYYNNHTEKINNTVIDMVVIFDKQYDILFNNRKKYIRDIKDYKNKERYEDVNSVAKDENDVIDENKIVPQTLVAYQKINDKALDMDFLKYTLSNFIVPRDLIAKTGIDTSNISLLLNKLIAWDEVDEDMAIDAYLINYLTEDVYDKDHIEKDRYNKYVYSDDVEVEEVLASALYIKPQGKSLESLKIYEHFIVGDSIETHPGSLNGIIISYLENLDNEINISDVYIIMGLIFASENIDYVVADGSGFFDEVDKYSENTTIVNESALDNINNYSQIFQNIIFRKNDVSNVEDLFNAIKELNYIEFSDHVEKQDVSIAYSGYSMAAYDVLNNIGDFFSSFENNLIISSAGIMDTNKLIQNKFETIVFNENFENGFPDQYIYTSIYLAYSMYLNTNLPELLVELSILDDEKDFLSSKITSLEFINIFDKGYKGYNIADELKMYLYANFKDESFLDLFNKNVKDYILKNYEDNLIKTYISETYIDPEDVLENIDNLYLITSQGENFVIHEDFIEYYISLQHKNKDFEKNVSLYVADENFNVDIGSYNFKTDLALDHDLGAIIYFSTFLDNVTEYFSEHDDSVRNILNSDFLNWLQASNYTFYDDMM